MKYIITNKDIDASFITLSMWMRLSDPRTKRQIGLPKPRVCIEIIKGQTIIYYTDAKTTPIFISRCANQLLKNPKLISYLIKNTKAITEKIRKISARSINKIDGLSDLEIIKLLKEVDYWQSEAVVFGIAFTFADIAGEISNLLTDIIIKRQNLKYPSFIYTEALTRPSRPGLTEKAYKAIKHHGSSSKILADKYFWLNQGYIGRGLTKTDVKKIQQEKDDNKKPISKKIIEKELKLSAKERKIFSIAKQIVYGKILRTDSRQFAHVIINKIIDKYAKQWQIDPKYLEILSIDELCQVIDQENNIANDLQNRWQHSLIYQTGKKYKCLTGQKAEQFLKKNSAMVIKTQTAAVTGQIAQTGKVKGIARLVFGVQHINKVKTGDILIAMATSPQLLPAMRRAAAFVTDVGGITSHAAIVSRELNKPCIVGTKHATQIFKDGDRLEVDAIAGVVKKI